ncbi:hypothetical protein BDD12DRAFT_736122, partial [Trichophaea hybrida]
MTTPSNPECVRVMGIQREVTMEDLIHALSAAFSNDENDIEIDGSIMPPCDTTENTNVALVCFRPKAPRYLDPLYSGDEDIQIDTKVGELSFDKHFYGLTQLYPTPPRNILRQSKPPLNSIIAVTKLDGHAYGSWRGRHGLKKMWLRDFFSKDLPTCRTMIYGYNSKLNCAGIHTILDYNISFLADIKRARRTKEEKERPIVFIGHSFGGVIIAQSVMQAAEAKLGGDPAESAIFDATRVLMFFGTPHRGMLTEDILSMVDHETHGERAELVQSINRSSRELESQLRRFINITPLFRSKIFSFYALRKSRKLVKGPNGTWSRTGDLIVPVAVDSALLNLPNTLETRIPVDNDHSNMVKFNARQDRTYRIVVSHL